MRVPNDTATAHLAQTSVRLGSCLIRSKLSESSKRSEKVEPTVAWRLDERLLSAAIGNTR